MSRVIYYNDETYDKVNQDSKILLQDYILELKAKGRAVKTIEQYEADIKSFLCYAYDNTGNKFMLDMKKRDFRNFFLKMQNDGKSSARINRMQSSLRNILEFAVDDDDEYPDYEKNQMKTIKSIEKQHVRDIVFLTDEQVTYLIDYYLEKEEYQKALYISLSYDSAGRRNEILQVEKRASNPVLSGSLRSRVTGSLRLPPERLIRLQSTMLFTASTKSTQTYEPTLAG